ncbi:MAG: DUF4402 domain-containing protein [Pseudobdellovibrionaceae bacterium]
MTMVQTTKSISFVAITTALIFNAGQAKAVSANGTITQTVNAALGITNESALGFGSAAAGDAPKIVLPGTVDNTANGSFNVTGQSGQTYTIILPIDGTVNLTTGAGGVNQTIPVYDFTSFPQSGANGLLAGAGYQLLLVGATRGALVASQVAGTYTGTYSVTVVY